MMQSAEVAQMVADGTGGMMETIGVTHWHRAGRREARAEAQNGSRSLR